MIPPVRCIERSRELGRSRWTDVGSHRGLLPRPVADPLSSAAAPISKTTRDGKRYAHARHIDGSSCAGRRSRRCFDITAPRRIRSRFDRTQLVVVLGRRKAMDILAARRRSLESPEPSSVMQNRDEACVNRELELGKDTGRWWPWNQCHTVVDDILERCEKK